MAHTYSNVRDRIKSGDVLALTHKAWGTLYDLQIQIVRFFTQSEYAHVGLIWEVGGRLFVIESVEPLVRIVPLSHFADEGFYWISMREPIDQAELEFALAKVGVARYSKWQAILAFLRRLKIGADNLESCTEFLIQCRRLSGLDMGQVATPTALVEHLLALGRPVRWVRGA